MKFHFISETGDGLGLAERLLTEGHDPCMWIRSSQAMHIGDGIIAKVGDLNDLVEGYDPGEVVFIFDGSGNGYLADSFNKRGYHVLGGSILADKLEHDREFGTSFMKDCGLQTPETFNFESWEDAMDFVKEYPDRLVYKPAKKLGEESPAHVSYDKEDMLEMLKNAQDETNVETPEFQLQQFVEGVAFSTELWFDGRDFIEPLWNHTLERKELMNDNKGPSGGCTGNIVWPCGYCPVCDDLRKVKAALAREQFVGMLDLNAIVNPDGIFGLEWTPRFGYDASPTLLYEVLEGGLGELFMDVAQGRYVRGKSPFLKEGKYGGGVRISIPPWPSEKFHAEQNVPIQGLEDNDWKRTYMYNVKAHEKKPDQIVSAGAWGILLLFTGIGDTPGRALVQPYKLADKVRVPNKQYRTDLKKQFEEDLEKLEEALDGIHKRVGRSSAA